MPTHAVGLHEWGTRSIGTILCLATRQSLFRGLDGIEYELNERRVDSEIP
jgi:hypothetical protein